MKVIFNFICRRETAFVLLGAAAVALRLWLAPTSLETTDDVNFALALDRYDLAHHQPHFPGYPLYVLAARAFHLAFAAPLALALPGILGTLVLMWAVARALRNSFHAFAAAALIAFAPTLITTSASPGSDGLALALAGAALAWPFAGGRFATSGVMMGLALGVRASYAPLVVSLLLLPPLLHRKGVVEAIVGLAAACAMWALPLIFIVGPAPLFHEAVLQIGGHFTRWGGSIATSKAGFADRALTLAAHSARGLLPLVVVAAFLRPRIDVRLAAALALPYALWAFLGQNLDHARHAAPLTALLCVGIAVAIDNPRRLAALAAGLVVCLLSLEAPHPWRRQAVERVRAQLGVERVLVAGTHLPRIAHYYAPELRCAPARDGAEVEELVRTTPPGVAVVVASEVPSLERPGLVLQPLDEHLYLATATQKLAVQP